MLTRCGNDQGSRKPAVYRATLARDVRDYVFSCGCLRLGGGGGGGSRWDIQDMGQRTDSGNRCQLVVVLKANDFLLLIVFLPPIKEALGVKRVMLDVVLPFGLSVPLRSDPGTEFTAKVVGYLCRWQNTSIEYCPADHARAQGTAERVGGLL